MRRTVADLANEIGVYIKTINLYQEILDVNFQLPKFVYRPQLYYLGGYQEVKNEFCNYVLANKEFLRELQKDYYLPKTPEFISHKIGCDVDDVIEIINQKKHLFFHQVIDFSSSYQSIKSYSNVKNYYEVKGVTEETIFTQISSYKILQLINLKTTMSLLEKNVKKLK